MADSCCPSCKGALGICRDHQCFHHLEVQALEDKDGRDLRLYPDPTSRQAINNITRRPRTRGRRR